jgi:hypothetical protein
MYPPTLRRAVHRLCCLAVMGALRIAHAATDAPPGPDGTWVLDADATERQVLALPANKRPEVGFAAGMAFYCPIIFVVTPEHLKDARYGSSRSSSALSRVLDRPEAYVYVYAEKNQRPETFTIERIDEDSIRILSSSLNDFRYAVWRRATFDPASAQWDDARKEACLRPFERLYQLLSAGAPR